MGAWAKCDQSGMSDWEIVHGRELYPRRLTSDDKWVKFDEGVETLKSIEELPEGRTWLLIRRSDEDHVMCWSPCTGERLMVPVELLEQVRTGLLLAASSGYKASSTALLLDYEERVLYAGRYARLEDGSSVTWSFSSLAGEWEAIPDRDDGDEEDVEELGKMYHTIDGFNPKLKVRTWLPSPAGLDVEGPYIFPSHWCHWYQGSLYILGSDRRSKDGKLIVLRWDASSKSWAHVASHAIYAHGNERVPGDFVMVKGGGRYLWATYGNSELDQCWGGTMVVYDLKDDQWHYKTILADNRFGNTRVLACNRGHTGHALLDAAFSAVWLNDPCHLSLPPEPGALELDDDEMLPKYIQQNKQGS